MIAWAGPLFRAECPNGCAESPQVETDEEAKRWWNRRSELQAWRPIEDRDRTIETIQNFGDVTLRNSHPVWVRDADGRVYEAVWTVDGKGRGYWWDTEGESPADPVDILPHPFTEHLERLAISGESRG